MEEKVTGLIEVSVIMEEPAIASDIANYIAEFVKKFVAAEQKKEAHTQCPNKRLPTQQ